LNTRLDLRGRGDPAPTIQDFHICFSPSSSENSDLFGKDFKLDAAR
jgi:hypothetical protein